MPIRIPAALAAIALSTMLSGCLTADPDAPPADLAAAPLAGCGPSGDSEAVPCPAEAVDPAAPAAPQETAAAPPATVPSPAADPVPAQPRRTRGRSAWNAD